MVAEVYAHSGTYGSSSIPTGNTLATSDGYAVNPPNFPGGLINFNFTGANRIVLNASTHYCIVARSYSGTWSASFGVGVRTDASSPTHSGNAIGYISGAWSAQSRDTIFYVYGVNLNDPPTYSNIAASTTRAGASATFSSHWNDDNGLSEFIFSTNNTGSWQNDTWTAFSSTPSWANVTKTLTSTVGVVGYRWYANDTDNAWSDTGTQTLMTTDGTAPTVSNIEVSSTLAGGSCVFSALWTDDFGLSGFTFSANGTGSWQNDTWTAFTGNPDWANVTKTLNSIVGTKVSYRWYANDTANNWADSGIYTLTTTGYSLNLKTVDQSGQPLQNTTILLKNGDTLSSKSTTGGWANWTEIVNGTVFQVNATWLFSDLYVNDTFSIAVNGDTSLNLKCRVYNFTFNGAVRHIGTDRNVTSASWSNSRFAFDFAASDANSTIVFDTGQVPTYILNMSYNIATSWNSSSGVFKGQVQNSTNALTICFDNWGDFYVVRVDDKLKSLSWTGQKLTITIDRQAAGTIALHCGSRGIPESTSGLTAASYSTTTKIFQATYAASGIVEVDWGSNPQDPQVPPPPVVSFSALTESLGKLKPGDTKTFKITVTFSSSSFTINSLTFTGAARSWCKINTPLPVTFVRVDPGAIEGTGELEVSVTIPGNTGSGNHTGTVVIYGVDPFGTLHETTLSLSFMVETSLPMGSWDFDWGAVDMNTTAAIITIAALVIVAMAVFVKKKSR
jgi:hypothetical protein